MKSIGIIIPTRNRSELLINCLESIFQSSTNDYDIYIVDNASTDNTYDIINEKYGDRVILIKNEIGQGSSGGFNTGFRRALKENYKYLFCCDDDIIVDSKAIKELYDFMEENNHVGIVGSKLYQMDDKERLQEFGSYIDFENFNVRVDYRNSLDNDAIPEVVYCDYVPACSMMIRSTVIHKIGIMNEENFVYWDDMDICHRAKKANYMVAVYGKSKIWHKMNGASSNKNATMFHSYYFNRNRINFFIKYCNSSQLNQFCNYILQELFRIIYGCINKKRYNRLKVAKYSYDDAIYSKLGQGESNRILPVDSENNNLWFILKESRKISIEAQYDIHKFKNVIREILNTNSKIEITTSNPKLFEILHNYNYKIQLKEEYILSDEELRVILCEHVSKVKKFQEKCIYIDPFNNFITNKEEFVFWSNYEINMEFFVEVNRNIFMKQANRIRKNNI